MKFAILMANKKAGVFDSGFFIFYRNLLLPHPSSAYISFSSKPSSNTKG